MRVIAVANQKGGCGKTTTSISVSAALASLGQKVLLIDNDPQAHSTIGLGIDADTLTASMFDVFDHNNTTVSLNDVIHKRTENLDVAPAEVILSVVEQKISGTQRRERKLSEEITNLTHAYDFIIIDCAPSVGLLTFNALYAADEVVIPVEPSYFSLHGLRKLRETIDLVNRMKKNQRPMSVHALITRYNGQEVYGQYLARKIRALFGDDMFQTYVRYDVLLQEATEHGKSIVEFNSDSNGYVDYMSVAIELMEKRGKKGLGQPAVEEKQAEQTDSTTVFAQLMRGEGTVFSLYAPEAARVEIAGDFVIWIPQMMRKDPDHEGMWQVTIPLLNGTYQYKFVVDGTWITDPAHENFAHDGLGGFNSLVHISETQKETPPCEKQAVSEREIVLV